MKTLNIYLQESLLDDFDDLEKGTDLTVARKGTIGELYDVNRIEDWGMLKRIDNSKLKKYPCYWDHNYNDVRVERVSKISKFDKPSSNEVDLINTLLSFDIDDIELGEYRQKNKILSFFKDLLNADGMEGRISKNRGKSEIELFIFNDGWNVGDEKELYIWLSKK